MADNLIHIAAIADLHRSAADALDSRPVPRVHPGGQWGHLRLLECIARGAFGEVYRAWDTRLDREVALKLLPADPSSDPHASTIIREGRLLAKVRFARTTRSGWQTAHFSHPVRITPHRRYVASYTAPNGHYAGAAPANFVQGVGLTCSAPPPGYIRDGFAGDEHHVMPGIHPYYRPGP